MQLDYGGWRLRLVPEHGGTVASLSKDGRDVLRPAASIEAIGRDPRAAAHYPCAPWFNRLFGGFDFGGRHWPLDPILDPCAALHGEGWVNAWRIATADQNHARLQFAHRDTRYGRFPFAFTAEQTFRLTHDAFELELRVRNDHDRPAPFGLGLHPFFVRTADTRIAFAAGGPASPPPTGISSWRSGAGDALPVETIDHSFIGFGGEATVTTGGSVLRLTSRAPTLHLYAPAGEDFLCLEPVTHAAGEFGGDVLAPGQWLALSLELSAAFEPSS